MSVQWLFGRICRYGSISDVWYGDEVVLWGGVCPEGMGCCGMVWGPWYSQQELERQTD